MVDLLYAGFLGLIAGLFPVYLGLLPLWFFKGLSERWRTVLVSFSAGILLFLFVDVTHEAVSLSGVVGSSPLFFVLGLVLGLAGPVVVSREGRRRKRPVQTEGDLLGVPSTRNGSSMLFNSQMIALGIGLHNLGEGLAIGASYAAGVFGLTTLLVVGFALHNSTEGLGISAPMASVITGVKEPILLGFLAGFPTILGSMIGSLAYSAALGTLFFAAASGALIYVVVELVKLSYSTDRRGAAYAGTVFGILLMYLTGLLVS